MSEEMKNIIVLKQRAEKMLKNDYSRKIGDEEIYTIICEWEKTFDLYNKEKQKNRTLEELLQGKLYGLYLYYKELAGSYQANSISKDKIKEKIKYYEQKKKDLLGLPDDCAKMIASEDCDEKLYIYKELLGE